MKLSPIILALSPAVLAEVISPAEPGGDCHADNCFRAVAGGDVRFDLKSRREDCSRFMATATSSPSPTPPTGPAATATALPVYASLCYSAAAYSSACSCWGITAAKITSDAGFSEAAATTAGVTDPLPSFLSSSRSITNSSVTSTFPSDRSGVLPTSITSTNSSIVRSSSSTIRSSISSIRSTSSIPSTKSSSTTTPSTRSSSFSPTSSSTTSVIPTSSTTPTNSTGGCGVGGKCGTYKSWACSGPLGDCLCGTDADGKSFCFEDNVCSLEVNCNVNKDCPSTQRCVTGSCCQVGKCVIERKDGACGNINSARALFRGRGEGESRRCEEGRNSGSC